MKCLTLKEYHRLVADSKVLEQDKHGAKVLKTVDNKIVKLFRRKRAITSAAFKPYAVRFVENAQRLKALGIKTVNIEAVYRCSPINRTLVVYRPVPGQTLRDAIRDSTNPDTLIAQFASFFAELHDKGVLFRSIHLNNVIAPCSPGSLGLIDIADMKFLNRALSINQRMRNLRHLTRYNEDRQSIKDFGVEQFVDIYFDTASLPALHKKTFLVKMQSVIEADVKI